MPLIDPPRLKKQIQQCLAHKSNAPLFVEAIKNLLENYSDYTYRPGEYANLPSTLKSYHVPQTLMRILRVELASLSQSYPTQALQIAREFWEQPYQECKELAISLLEHLPIEMEKEIFEISEQWVSSCVQSHLVETIARNALRPIRLEQPADLINQAQKWIFDEHAPIRKFGFLVLEQVSLSISFGDLPLLFKVISPFIHRCPPQIFPEIVLICDHLIAKSPKEMAYLMRTAITQNPAGDAKKLIKSCLKSFPTELQAELQAELKR